MKKKTLTIVILHLLTTSSFSQFKNPVDISKSTSNVVMAEDYDVDNDGDLDILTTSWGDDKLAWYENDGIGNFSTQKLISDQVIQISDSHMADINGDGFLDAIVAQGNNDKISYFLNQGSGNFLPPVIISDSLNNPQSIYSADLDGDGDMDVVSASRGDNKIAWYINDGAGSFSNEQIISTTVQNAIFVYTSDIDNDGDEDVLAASLTGNTLSYYLNDGSGVFSTAQIISSTLTGVNSIYCADIDGDSDLDVVAGAYYDNKLVWFSNDGGGNFSAENIISTNVNNIKTVEVTDIDNDGDMDVVSASRGDNKVAWFMNDGSGVFSTEIVITTDAFSVNSATTADYDNDGDSDVLSASFGDGDVILHLNDGFGTFNNETYISASLSYPSGMCAVDMGNDNDLDVFVTNFGGDRIVWYENLGNGGFSKQTIISTNNDGHRSVFAADLDNDADYDIIVTSTNDHKVVWYENIGNNQFSAENIITNTTDQPIYVIASDLNNDGYRDVVLASRLDDKITWYINDGAGNFSSEQIITSNADGVNFLISVDVDLDGQKDIISTSDGDNKIAWYKNNGNSTFSSEHLVTISQNSSPSMSGGDIDNDGDFDIIASNMDNSNAIVWFSNDGTGTFSLEQIIPTNVLNTGAIDCSDIDNDGDLDIVSGSIPDDKLVWYENDGTGVFSVEQIISSSHTYANSSLICKDVNFDGDNDILTLQYSENKLSYFENITYYNTQIQGHLYFDLNQNGFLDSLEIGLPNISMGSNPNSDYTYTLPNGDYLMNFSDIIGTYNVLPNQLEYWSITSDSTSYTVVIDSIPNYVDSLDFGFFPDTLINDLHPSLTGGFPRCNDTIMYWVNVNNLGTTFPSGVIHLSLDPSISYIGSAYTPDSIVGQNVYWHYDSLFPFLDHNLNLEVELPPVTSISQSVLSNLFVHTLQNGVVTHSDTSHLSQNVVCSYDPNDKTSIPKGIGNEGYISPVLNEIEYLVRFQNTGTDTAFTVVITDQLSTNLNWSTFQPIASSHSVQTSLDQNGEISFTFNNIMLPDSNVNNLGSQGFIKYKVQLEPNLLAGDEIHNTALIYFDLNPAVVTNTVTNTIYNCTSMNLNSTSLNLCVNSEFSASIADEIFSNYIWSIENDTIGTDNSIDWTLNTAGLHNIQLEKSNSICSIDTILPIIVHPTSNTNETYTTCTGDSLLHNGEYYYNNQTFIDTLQSLSGCDSIIITDFVFNSSYLFTNEIKICNGDSVMINNTYQGTPGVYTNILQTINGCDSIFNTHLNYYLPLDTLFMDEVVLICYGDSIQINGNYESIPGLYINNLQTVNGCDSAFYTNLDFFPYMDTIYVQSLDTYTSPSGNLIYLNSGTYSDTLITTAGCDSIVVINLHLDFTGFDSNPNLNSLTVYPNPTNGLFNIQMNNVGDFSVKIYSSEGRLVYNEECRGANNHIIKMNEASGIYYIEIEQDGFKKRIKFILQN